MQPRNTGTINIGLNNNPMTETEILTYLQNVGFEIVNYRVVLGEYEGQPEPTLVINFNVNAYQSTLILRVEIFCQNMTQECIPVQTEQFSILVYNSEYTGQRYAFNSDYFLN